VVMVVHPGEIIAVVLVDAHLGDIVHMVESCLGD
jgi:hypothetical protein